ncbi:MAG: multicopper oxidase domain-containing protein [Steroidobacteraceae bacterium]
MHYQTLGFALRRCSMIMAALVAIASASTLNAATVNVTVTNPTNDFDPALGVRWVLEEDVTHEIDPANPVAPISPSATPPISGAQIDTATFTFHKSYMPLSRSGESAGPSFAIPDVDPGKRYYLSVLPNRPADSTCTTTGAVCYTMSGAPVRFPIGAAADAALAVRVVLTPQPIPPAQARVYVFDDRNPINNSPDATEPGLGGFAVFIYDAGGGPMVTDAFGNPLGTVYVLCPNGEWLDDDAAPCINRLGDGTIHTMTAAEVDDPVLNPNRLKVGEVLIQNLAPGKYGIQVVPPAGQGWKQTTTIEGTPGIDVWLRSGEPTIAVEFGPTFAHAFFGFVKEFNNLSGTHSISGNVVTQRIARPGLDPTIARQLYPGDPVSACWIGLNDSATGEGVYVGKCSASGDGTFTIPNVPDGTYQVVVWDQYLDLIITFATAVVDGANVTDLEIQAPNWFADQEHFVFNDLNGNGVRDADEPGIPEQAINIRFRDGSINFASATDVDGYLPIEELFPFFSWEVAEVDFARFDASSVRVTVDEGGPLGNTQPPRIETTGSCGGAANCEQVDAPPLLEGFQSFSGTNHTFEWGKKAYAPGKNGGITGVVYYQVTRAENDPRFAAPETWEPGIPRVQVNLYSADASGNIQDINGIAGIQLADVDNYPFCWSDPDSVADTTLCPTGIARGPEDEVRSGNGVAFSQGDALEVTHTDSWDDNLPTDCVNDTLLGDGPCYDGLRNWTQVRPAVFDGGYAFGEPFTSLHLNPGTYVIEANTPDGYLHQTEQSKNVDFGDTIRPQALPPVCVGDPTHVPGLQVDGVTPNQDWNNVPGELELFPGVPIDARYTGDRPFCNFKQVLVTDGKNAAADFFMYTLVPLAGHIQGNSTNDIGSTANPNSPAFGEKQPPAYIPISIRDYAGNEVNRLYTDRYGRYNGLVPSTYRINAPMPTGVSPNMVQVCLNAPTMPNPADPSMQIPDPYFDPRFSQGCYTLNFSPATTTYLDTPVLPVAAFTTAEEWQIDTNYPSGTPVIYSASAAANGVGGGPFVPTGVATTLTLRALGTIQVPNPALARPATEPRDYGFGSGGTVTLNGQPLALVGAWDANEISVTIPAGATTGQLMIQRTDSQLSTVTGVTVIVGNPAAVRAVAPGGTVQDIQAQIDAAGPGGIVLVPPGLYYGGLIVTKPVQLQGWGAPSVIINSGRNVNYANFLAWQRDVHNRANCTGEIGLLPGQPNNIGGGTNLCNGLPGSGLFATEENAGVLIAPRSGVFGSAPARVDGFTFMSSDYAAGVLVNGYTSNLVISNNVVSNNQGLSAGGVRIGHPNLVDGNGQLVSAYNSNVNIHHNKIASNSSTFDHGGGVALYQGSDNYRVTDNYIVGNFTQGDGAGIAHYGRSPGGVIEHNQVLINQSYDQTAQSRGGSGGGIFVAGHEAAAGAVVNVSTGSGSVRINANRIQGNQAGAGDGGGIALRWVNGQDVANSPNASSWDRIDIFNNIITNNVAALAGAVSLQDALAVNIVNNTIVNNDSIAAASAAFTNADPNVSDPQPAGIVSRAHSADLAALPGVNTDFSNARIRNNIILGNRQQYWNGNIPPGPGLIVVPNGVSDLAVLGAGGGARLDAEYNILTQNPSNNGYPSNNPRVPLSSEDALLREPFYNGNTSTATFPFNAASFDVPLVAAAATDEGGNFVSAWHGPLAPVGNYHLEAGSSAIDPNLGAGGNGTNSNLSLGAALVRDYDGDSRPVDGTAGNGVTMRADIGADEAPAVANATPAPPQILSVPQGCATIFGTPTCNTYFGVPFQYQVIAADPNGYPPPITYIVERVNLFGGTLALPAGVSIGSTSGLLTWTPTSSQGGTYLLRVTAYTGTNNTANRARQTFALIVSDGQVLPTPANQSFDVTSNGGLSQPAPGVLSGYPALPAIFFGSPSAELVGNLNEGGTVTLAQDGSFSYQPAPNYVGTPTFQFRVGAPRVIGAILGDTAYSDVGTVTLNRELAVTRAEYFAASGGGGRWEISGLGSINGRTITVTRDGANELVGSTTVGGGTWTIVVTGGPAWVTGDTVTVVASGTGAPGDFTVAAVPVIAGAASGTAPATTAYVQCKGDTNGDGISDTPGIVCRHLAAGDGFIRMADGREIYTFGFNDVTGVPENEAIAEGLLNANFPAPTLAFDEGDEVYLSLTNVGTIMRPDLFDPHTVHFHGFPNAASVFDGVPESSIAINGGFTFTYYYNIVEPGTFMYHCHVEAAEHMQMGMLGSLYVRPKQNALAAGGTVFGDGSYSKFVYNDGDGSTGYDVEVPIQIGSMDSNFHDEHLAVQPLPFADMHDDYPMLNGRGYPDTVNPNPIDPVTDGDKATSGVRNATTSSQPVSALVEARAGDRVLLRISNLNVTQFYTLATTGLPMKVVGTGAHILRGPGEDDLYYTTNSITLGGGEAVDVLVDIPAGAAVGTTWILYSTNLNELSNGEEDFGGMMTEIRVVAP